jgi:hypothetical protein
VLGTFVCLTNLAAGCVLAPLLLAVLHPRLRHARLLYRDLLGPRPRRPAWRRTLGVVLVVVGTATAFGAGQLIAGGWWLPPWAPFATPTGALAVGIGLLPMLALAVAGLALL